jgi:hypothetical protein
MNEMDGRCCTYLISVFSVGTTPAGIALGNTCSSDVVMMMRVLRSEAEKCEEVFIVPESPVRSN